MKDEGIRRKAIGDPPLIEERDVTSLALAALNGTPSQASAIAFAVRHRGVAVDDIVLDLLQPAARLIGRWWEADRCGFAEVTAASCRLSALLGHLSEFRLPGEQVLVVRGRCLASVVPGEGHNLGLAILTDMMEADGWLVERQLQPSVGDLVDRIAGRDIDLVVLSAGTFAAVQRMPGLIQALRRAAGPTPPPIFAGGQPFLTRPDLLMAIGADGGACEARVALAMFREIVSNKSDTSRISSATRESTYATR
jgi:MerR family transcriptional regulator, light-induced transcriptional regulator